MTKNRRPRPKMGDALIVNAVIREMPPQYATVAAVAECECGEKVYTAVSSSQQSVMRLIQRKHVRHLPNCRRQRELFLLDKVI